MTEENNGGDGWATVTTTKQTKQSSKRDLVLKRQKSNGSATGSSTPKKPQRSVSSAGIRSNHQQTKRESKRSNSFSSTSRAAPHSTSKANGGQNRGSFSKSNSNRSLGKQSGGGGKSGSNRNAPSRSPSNSQNQRRDSTKKPSNGRTISDPLEYDLINSSSESVVRWSAHELLAKRLQHVDPPIDWAPNARCTWRDEKSRMERIRNDDTLFNDYSPLAINEDTRWKSKAMLKTPSPTSADSEAVVIAKLQSILNKLSWTNLDKLTVQFLGSLGTTVEQHMIQTSLRLVARKASLEPHFGPLYARLSVKLALTHKAFKKTLLSICKELFDQLTENGDVDKKELIGLTKFVGELYVQKLIRGPIMVGCCDILLQSETDDAKLEAASQVLTIVGQDLDTERPEGIDTLWEHVTALSSSGSKVSKRIQFLLQAVLEVRGNKWVNIRHQQESAMTIAQVHAQAAADAKKGPVVSTSALRRSRSSEGFGRKRQKSPLPAAVPAAPTRSPLRRVRSEAPGKSSLQTSLQSSLQRAALASANGQTSNNHGASVQSPSAPDPDTAAKEFVSALRDFFVHGDVNEIILSTKDVSLDNAACGAAAISSGVLFVLEKKECDVRKLLEAVDHCVQEGCFSGKTLVDGLVEPLDLLRDIEIDAPLAPKFLATIVAHWLKSHATLEDIVQSCSRTFKEDGRPEEFFAKVLHIRCDVVKKDELRVFKNLCENDTEALKHLVGLPLQNE